MFRATNYVKDITHAKLSSTTRTQLNSSVIFLEAIGHPSLNITKVRQGRFLRVT